MNRVALNESLLQNRHLVVRADQDDTGFRIGSGSLKGLLRKHGRNFCIIIYGFPPGPDDFFVVPFQALDYLLAKGRLANVDGGGEPGWSGRVRDSATLSLGEVDGDVRVESCHNAHRLLDWLIDGFDLFSFTRFPVDEAAEYWPPYEPFSQGNTDFKETKNLLLVQTQDSDLNFSSRPGQSEFREALLARYGERCLVTGCPLPEVVQAAHIVPYAERRDHHPSNGLLLRADIHVLFDRHLLGIEPETMVVSVHPEAQFSGYEYLHRRRLFIPEGPRPCRQALAFRWTCFQEALPDLP